MIFKLNRKVRKGKRNDKMTRTSKSKAYLPIIFVWVLDTLDYYMFRRRCLDMFLDVRGLPKWTPTVRWDVSDAQNGSLKAFSSTPSPVSFNLKPFFFFFCYFTVNVGKIKRASSSGRILFFFSIQPKKVSFWFFPIFSGKIKCLCWSLPFSRERTSFPQCRTSFRKE